MIKSLYAFFALLVSIFVTYIIGKQSGKEQEKNEQNKEIVEDIKNAKKIDNDINNLSNDDKRNRLSNYAKD